MTQETESIPSASEAASPLTSTASSFPLSFGQLLFVAICAYLFIMFLLGRKIQFLVNVVSKIVFQPPYHRAQEALPTLVWMRNSKTGKRVAAHFLQHSSATKTIVYAHGNACDIDQMLPFLDILRENLVVNVLHYEYPGYSHMRTELPTEQGVYDSADTAMEYLLTEKRIPQNNIILMGTSLGSAASVYLAAKYPEVDAVILECPFTSIVKTQTELFLGSLVDMLESHKRISKVESKVLIIHGERDSLVPVSHGKWLLANCKNKRSKGVWIPTADHNNIFSSLGYARYVQTLRDFINS